MTGPKSFMMMIKNILRSPIDRPKTCHQAILKRRWVMTVLGPVNKVKKCPIMKNFCYFFRL